jgi:succinate dehydrogenase / fumarate reductase flavoprotein subunit
VLGEANFSDHGANRLGANALLQGLADGYFIIPETIGDYFATDRPPPASVDHAAFRDAERDVRAGIQRLLDVEGGRPADSFHRELGRILRDRCGMARNAGGLREAIARIETLRDEFWSDLRVTGTGEEFNVALEKAGRVADYLEFAPVLCHDALDREESCGGHFREEHQTREGEAQRDDERFCHVSVWEYRGSEEPPAFHKEPLTFETAELATRSYK